MRRIALLTTLAMSAGAVAYADPPVIRGEAQIEWRDRDTPWARDRYERYDRSRWGREYRGRWHMLGGAFPASNDRQFIPVRGERLRRLRIEAVRGAPAIDKIAVEFRDGTSQVVELDMRLPRGSGEVINLGDDRRVQRIIVYTHPDARGTYAVYGT